MRLLSLLSSSIFALLLAIHPAGAQISWQPLPVRFDNDVRCFYVDSTDTTLYAGGNFSKLNGVYSGCIVKLARDYSPLPLPQMSGAGVLCITRWRGDLYMGGFGAIFKLSGNSWIPVYMRGGMVSCMIPYKDKLLIGGQFYDGFDNDTALKTTIAEYDGTNFRNFNGVDSVIAPDWFVYAIVEYKGELIVSGNFNPRPGINRGFKEIIKWTGTKWTDVGGGIRGGGLDAMGNLLVINDDLFVAGYCSKAEGAPGNSILRWNGSSWDDMDGGANGVVFDLASRGDTLLVSGIFDKIGGRPCSNFAAYVHGKWSVNTVPFDDLTEVSVDFFGDLVVGGGFDTIGTDTCNMIAQIKSLGTQFHSTSVKKIPDAIRHFAVTPNPSGGLFRISMESGQPIRNLGISVWSLNGARVWQSSAHPDYKSYEQSIDLSQLSKGLYFMEVVADGQRIIRKVEIR